MRMASVRELIAFLEDKNSLFNCKCSLLRFNLSAYNPSPPNKKKKKWCQTNIFFLSMQAGKGNHIGFGGWRNFPILPGSCLRSTERAECILRGYQFPGRRMNILNICSPNSKCLFTNHCKTERAEYLLY